MAGIFGEFYVVSVSPQETKLGCMRKGSYSAKGRVCAF